MSSSFDLPELRSFAVGTEGPAGERVFYLQAVAEHQVVTLRLEKQQVALLADYLARVIASYELAESSPTSMPDLYQPVISEWIVGSMMVAIDEAESRVIVIAEELVIEDDDAVARLVTSALQEFGFFGGQRRIRIDHPLRVAAGCGRGICLLALLLLFFAACSW